LVIGWRVLARSHVVNDAVRRINACPLFSSSKTKPCQFSSVQFSYSYVALYEH